MPMISPKEFLGFAPGADRCLADWDQMLAYFRQLAGNSDRVTMDQLGLTTEGLPFVQLIITSPENHMRLDEYRQVQARLADPRGLSQAEADELLKLAKTIVMISCGVHSTEIAGVQYSLDLAYELATGNDAHTHEILDNVILILVPSLNPDGHKMVVDWYRENLGTPYEGCPMPWLYQKYVGHDNNRDWYMCTQVENRLTVEKIHNVWHPQVVYDMHQMGPTTARFFIPPYVDPIDPNVDPILQQEIVWIGSAMANQLTAEGKSGVVIHAIYDAWTPARAYQHYHGGIRILTEAASVKIATPVTVPFEQLTTGLGYDAKKQTWNHPMPWPGGEWHLSDIVEYERSASHALLTHAARYRDTWVRNFYQIGLNAINRKTGPYAFVIPAEQKDPATTAKLLNVLHTGMVELHVAEQSFTAGGEEYAAGSVVVLMKQPYGAFAKTLLETQHYPDIRQYPGGPLQRPYDVTAQTLPLLMGVKVATVAEPFDAQLTRMDAPQAPRCELPTATAGCYLIAPSQNEAFTLANHLVSAGLSV
ncbi:MAG: M14 metallopeptidase family protein, partial [Bacillota bacterium]